MIDTTTYRTDYFERPWTWGKRILIFLVFVLAVVYWELNDGEWDYAWIKYALLSVLSAGIFLSPVDDIMIDDKFFYHIRTSLLKKFSRQDKYNISTFKAIRCIGIHAPGITLQEMGHTRHFSSESNTLEITFKDGSYKSLELAIYKSELLDYVSAIRARMS